MGSNPSYPAKTAGDCPGLEWANTAGGAHQADLCVHGLQVTLRSATRLEISERASQSYHIGVF